MSRSKRWVDRTRLKPRCARRGREGSCPVSASTLGSSWRRYEALYAGLGDQRIVTTLCPGGKERIRRLMAMVANRRMDLTPLVTHAFALDDIADAYNLFSRQGDRVMKVALFPNGIPAERRAGRAEAVIGTGH